MGPLKSLIAKKKKNGLFKNLKTSTPFYLRIPLPDIYPQGIIIGVQ